MSKTHVELENLEFGYLKDIYNILVDDDSKIIKWLASRDKIIIDWEPIFNREKKKSKTGAVHRGAERVFYALVGFGGRWIPNSSPIGSDMFFEDRGTAYIHIEIKTSQSDNDGDFGGVIAMGENQTSYKATASNNGSPISHIPNLPQYYSDGLPCTTYAIHLIYEPVSLDTVAILLICIPNGQLFEIYGNDIINKGKSKKDGSLRYAYKRRPTFETLLDHPLRVKCLYYNPKFNSNKKLTQKYIIEGVLEKIKRKSKDASAKCKSKDVNANDMNGYNDYLNNLK